MSLLAVFKLHTGLDAMFRTHGTVTSDEFINPI